tara:strand:+ start:1797 stop:2513 length:717 start_codon:yes stop_codon:yes gene_type:complete
MYRVFLPSEMTKTEAIAKLKQNTRVRNNATGEHSRVSVAPDRKKSSGQFGVGDDTKRNQKPSAWTIDEEENTILDASDSDDLESDASLDLESDASADLESDASLDLESDDDVYSVETKENVGTVGNTDDITTAQKQAMTELKQIQKGEMDTLMAKLNEDSQAEIDKLEKKHKEAIAKLQRLHRQQTSTKKRSEVQERHRVEMQQLKRKHNTEVTDLEKTQLSELKRFDALSVKEETDV